MNKIRGRKGYEFNADFMKEAFGLFCQGLGPTAIVERMRDEWPVVCRQTVGKIVNKYNWKKKRVEFMDIKATGNEEKELTLKLINDEIERLERVCKSDDKSRVHSQLLNFLKFKAVLKGWIREENESFVLANDLEMNRYLEAIEEVLGEVYKKAKGEIKRVWEEKLKGEK